VIELRCEAADMLSMGGMSGSRFVESHGDRQVDSNARTRKLFYALQPFVAKGLTMVLTTRLDSGLVTYSDHLASTAPHLQSDSPKLILRHLASGFSLAQLHKVTSTTPHKATGLWWRALGNKFVSHVTQLKLYGRLPSDRSEKALLAALRQTHGGDLSFAVAVIEAAMLDKRIVLGRKQSPMVALISQQFKKHERAHSLRITAGTVKCYPHRVSRKFAVNNRLAVALYGVKNMFREQIRRKKHRLSRESLAETHSIFPRTRPLRCRTSAALRLLT
jgi:DNA-binding NarL/FixJ family response regulator